MLNWQQMPRLGVGALLLLGLISCSNDASYAPTESPPAKVDEEKVGSVNEALNGVTGAWTPRGPSPYNNTSGSVVPNNQVNGAIRDIAVDPTNASIAWAAGANGGIWKTVNLGNPSPHWVPQTDTQPSLSIGALSIDPTNNQQLLAGEGIFSSFLNTGGPLNGLLFTNNGGTTWNQLTDPVIVGQNFRAVAIFGNTFLAASDVGFFRSTNAGANGTWTTISGGVGTGLPIGVFYDLVRDPNTAGRYYTAIQGVGVFRSNDFGATWANVTSGGMTAVFQGGGNDNAKLAVANTGRVYVIVSAFKQAAYIGTSADAGATWAAMDLIRTPDFTPANVPIAGAVSGATNASPIVITTSAPHGLNCLSPFPINVRIAGVGGNAGANGDFVAQCVPIPPGPNTFSTTQFQLVGSSGTAGYTAGGSWQQFDGLGVVAQGFLHLAIAVDPTDPNVVYVAGDAGGTFTGGRGAIWRGDIRLGATNAIPSGEWAYITGTAVPQVPGSGTLAGTMPHSDGRRLVFDKAGNLLYGSDGGIFSRSSPQNNTGDWSSKNGDISVTEIYSIAFDPVSRVIIAGMQDNGTGLQTGAQTWTEIGGGDGGDVTIDAVSSPGKSIRYVSGPYFGGLTRLVYDASNIKQSSTPVRMQIASNPAAGCAMNDPFLATGSPPQPGLGQVRASKSGGNRLVLGAAAGVYESSNLGDCLVLIPTVGAPGASVGSASDLAYGNSDNANVLYATSGSGVFIRTAAGGNLTQSAMFPGGAASGVVMKPGTSSTAYVITASQVFVTPSTGTVWTDITGDLGKLFPRTLRAITYVPGPNDDRIVVAADAGVFLTSTKSLGFWNRLGSNLPPAPMRDIDYDSGTDTLAVGSLGRGAWTFVGASTVHLPPVALCKNISPPANASCQASVAPGDVNAGSYGPDGNPVTLASLNPPGPFTRPSTFFNTPTPTTLTVTDTFGSSESCIANVTVKDTTPPTIAVTNPATVQLVACSPSNPFVTLTAPAASDICNCYTMSGTVTAVNGTPTSIPLTPTTPGPGATTFQGSLPVGTDTVQWVATNCDGVPSTPFTQTVTIIAAPALYGRHNVNMDNLARAVTAGGFPATIDNDGSLPFGLTTLGLGTTAGAILSVPSVNLTGSTVDSVVSGGLVVNVGATVHGTTSQFTTPTLPPFPNFTQTYPFNLNEVLVLPLATVNLPPGAYDNVVVNPGGTLVLTHGTYTFNTLNIDPAASLSVDNTGGEVDVYVQLQVLHIGAIVSNGLPNQFILRYSGILPVPLLTNYTGVVIAPNALLTLSLPLFGSYSGAFYAQDIAVAAGVTVTEYPFGCR